MIVPNNREIPNWVYVVSVLIGFIVLGWTIPQVMSLDAPLGYEPMSRWDMVVTGVIISIVILFNAVIIREAV